VRFAEGLQLNHGNEVLAKLGLVDAKFLGSFDIKQDVFYADIHWDVLVTVLQSQSIKFKEIARFPEVRRDLALLVDHHITFGDLYEFSRKADQSILKDVRLFDVYTGDKLPEGKKSYALSFHLQDSEKTLTDKQIESTMALLQKGLESEFGATLRQ
jgi:phenylalanyl-tRNA synthetase beta chain